MMMMMKRMISLGAVNTDLVDGALEGERGVLEEEERLRSALLHLPQLPPRPPENLLRHHLLNPLNYKLC